MIEIDDDQNEACHWLDDGFSLLSESVFGFEFFQELKLLFFWIEEMVTWKRDDDLFDDFEEFDGVDFGLEFFDEFSVKIEANFAFDLRVKEEGENGDRKFVPEPEIKREFT